MRQIVMLDDGLRILEEGIVKAKHILIGHPPKRRHCSLVLPSLNDKHDAYLLIELLQMWKNYKVMTKCLLGFFMYLDHHFVGRRSIPSLNDLAILCFHDIVCSKLFGCFKDVAISLEQNGKQIQQDLLKNILNFFLEIGEGKIDYYITFEQLMLEEAASYYSQLALELLCCISYADFIRKVVWLLIQEQERAGQYLKQASLEKLLEIVKWKLMGETTQVLIQKQKSESHDTATYQLDFTLILSILDIVSAGTSYVL
ncbi:hypothetical protein ACB098_03G036300 [Castanea mollissima]